MILRIIKNSQFIANFKSEIIMASININQSFMVHWFILFLVYLVLDFNWDPFNKTSNPKTMNLKVI